MLELARGAVVAFVALAIVLGMGVVRSAGAEGFVQVTPTPSRHPGRAVPILEPRPLPGAPPHVVIR